MAFELPFPPFPHDSRDVPFIATPDDNNGYAVPSSQYFKKLVGEKRLWTPVSSDDPMPSSDVAAQAQLAEILAKLSADPATQTTLAAILAKIIDAPATEAKQTALNALIGEVQAAPTANTLLARLKNLETKVDAIIADGLKLSGSNIPNTQAVPNRQQNRVVISTLLNAVSVPVYNAEDLFGTTVTTDYTPDGASEIYLAVNIDKQPWSVGVETWTGYSGGEGMRTYPPLQDITQTFSNLHIYKLALIYSDINTIEAIDSYEKALRAAYYPIGGNMIIRIWNKHATDVATVTIRMIKVWRNR